MEANLQIFYLIIFSLLYFYIANWFQVNTFVKHLSSSKKNIKIIENKEISQLIKRKTGINLKRIIVFNSQKMFGMMPGIPLHPELILSSKLLETLNKDELEWVLLHEAGHCVMWHVVKCGVVQILIFIFGIFLLIKTSANIPLLFMLSIILSLISVQLMRFFERQADKYSIQRVDSPNGVITAQEKFSMVNRGTTRADTSLARKILHWNIMPSERIIMAQKRMV